MHNQHDHLVDLVSTIRQATAIDLKTITQYTLELHQHEDDGTIQAHQNFYLNLKKWLSTELANPRSLFLMAEKDNNPIGFIGATSIINDNGFLASPIKGVIQLLWVEPEFRNNHIANKLVDEVEHCFNEIGIEYVECSYTASNQLAEAFWEKHGYKKNSVTSRKLICTS